MNLVIFNHHALTPDMGGGTRHYDFAKELVGRGHKVTIIASSFHYAAYKETKTYVNSDYLKECVDGVDFIWIKTHGYKSNGPKRVFNMLEYMYKAQKVQMDRKADVVIGSSVHLFAVYAAWKFAKQAAVPFVMEVRDIWPRTLIDMGMSKWHPFILLLGFLERFLYKKADKIITLLPDAHVHIESFGVKKEDIVWISNGVDTTRFKNLKKTKRSEKFLITYAGSMGQANVLSTLMDVARELDKKYVDIGFQLIGEGALKQELIEYKKHFNVKNTEILPAVSKDEIAQVLKESDILYLGLKDSPLYRFGVSLNKLFDYLAAEVPIIFAGKIKNNPVEEASAGYCIPAEDKDALQSTIVRLYEMREDERTLYSKGNLNYIEKNFSIQFLTEKLENLLNGLVWKKK